MEMSDIFERAGGVTKLAAKLKRHHASLLGWRQVPAEHVPEVSRLTDIPRHELRPDLWDPPITQPAEATNDPS
jgi:DNA-binding transcriptional regulator YdaS (Cro superfamily)